MASAAPLLTPHVSASVSGPPHTGSPALRSCFGGNLSFFERLSRAVARRVMEPGEGCLLPCVTVPLFSSSIGSSPPSSEASSCPTCFQRWFWSCSPASQQSLAASKHVVQTAPQLNALLPAVLIYTSGRLIVGRHSLPALRLRLEMRIDNIRRHISLRRRASFASS